VCALNGVSFTFARGSFAALVGPSGSGKTTLMNLASGLDRPTLGKIEVADQIISDMSQVELCKFRRTHIGFVFQAYNLFPSLNAIENVEFTSLIRGDDSVSSKNRAIQALKTVGLQDKLKSYPHQLSGGQQQRVAVARALATQPDIIFADEPTANLDSKTAQQLIDLFEFLHLEKKATFLFSTHDHRLLHRVQFQIQIEDGRIL